MENGTEHKNNTEHSTEVVTGQYGSVHINRNNLIVYEVYSREI